MHPSHLSTPQTETPWAPLHALTRRHRKQLWKSANQYMGVMAVLYVLSLAALVLLFSSFYVAGVCVCVMSSCSTMSIVLVWYNGVCCMHNRNISCSRQQRV